MSSNQSAAFVPFLRDCSAQMSATAPPRRLRVLCLHGWRTSAAIMAVQLRNFPADLLDLHFLDGAHLAKG
jgi:hypothetical protein